jgi:hypothetical protein
MDKTVVERISRFGDMGTIFDYSSGGTVANVETDESQIFNTRNKGSQGKELVVSPLTCDIGAILSGTGEGNADKPRFFRIHWTQTAVEIRRLRLTNPVNG